MPLLGVFINAGAACLASGLTCIAHGTSQPFIYGGGSPDWAGYQIRSQGAAAVSLPVSLESLTATLVIWRNPNGVGINGSMLVAAWHGIIR